MSQICRPRLSPGDAVSALRLSTFPLYVENDEEKEEIKPLKKRKLSTDSELAAFSAGNALATMMSSRNVSPVLRATSTPEPTKSPQNRPKRRSKVRLIVKKIKTDAKKKSESKVRPKKAKSSKYIGKFRRFHVFFKLFKTNFFFPMK